jgi:beta-lactam-binding protein with PASTA domain
MLPDKSPNTGGAASLSMLHGRYELGEKIGEGSFFTVFRGRDTQTGRAIAIKLLNEEYVPDHEFTEHLCEQTRTTIQLDHPHIVSVFDVWLDDGRVTIVTELIRGIDLKERVRRVAPFPLAVAVDIAAAVSEALEYAAGQGITHGDLRPENILVTPEGQVKLTDFGLGSAVTASSRLQMSALLHSAHYLPPEVAQGKAPTPASDVYSLGAILFEMLSGEPPFDAESPFAIAVKHLHDPPPLLRRLNPGVPKAVEGIVQKCLQKDPAARYASPAALLADFRSVRDALRYGKPLTWTPALEPASAAAKPAPVPPRRSRPEPAQRPPPEPRAPVAVPAVTGGEPSTRLLVLLPLMALALAAGVFMLFVFSTRAPKDAYVPNVLGMTRDEAQRRLEEQGLHLRVLKETYDDKKPAGTITLSIPPEGSQVKQGKEIEVWISKGAEPSVVPNIVGVNDSEARSRIADARLTVGQVTQEYDETVPKGNVLSQEPAAQTEVTRKSEVGFVVSKGPEPTLPPEPTTPPESAPVPPSDTSTSGSSGPDSLRSDTSGTPGSGTENGTITDTSGASATQGLSDSGAPEKKDRTFDVTTKIEPGSGKSRIRIIVTDDHGRNEQINELYRRGQTIHNTIKARGAPGTVRIEVYENGQLVKHMQY